MQIIETLKELNIEENTAIAIGKFDGIHEGHKKLLEKVVEKKKAGLKAVVFTFDIQAASFFGGADIKEITTKEEKRFIFEELGVDVLIEFPLNKETAATPPDVFIKDILVDKLSMKYICAGDDVSFGAMGKGDAKLLLSDSNRFGYEVEIIDKITYKDREISATYIREEINKGNMEEVTCLLGHPYSFDGEVKRGFQLGHKLGMPTLNLYPDERKILPPLGVYFSKVIYKGCEYKGITNIGMRPTVSDTERISVETYLYDFDMDMYGEKITTLLLKFKRPEMKFSDVAALKAQMEKDIQEGAAFPSLHI